MPYDLSDLDEFSYTYWTGDFFIDEGITDSCVVSPDDPADDELYAILKTLADTWDAEEHDDESYVVYRRPSK